MALRERGLLFVGIDVIDGNLTEINVTSPTGIRAIQRLNGPDVAAMIWDTIEKKRGGNSDPHRSRRASCVGPQEGGCLRPGTEASHSGTPPPSTSVTSVFYHHAAIVWTRLYCGS